MHNKKNVNFCRNDKAVLSQYKWRAVGRQALSFFRRSTTKLRYCSWSHNYIALTTKTYG